ncbi:hypothetical protein PGKDCPLP_04088 [Stenotrophomonas maltophilia]|nr:hypothetical protein PGKDCPLP_04088 [Stenotrophomonas maltophilia]
MAGDGFFNLARTQPVTGHIDHIIGATEDEGVAIVVTDRPVQRAVQQLLEVAEVALQETAVVVPHRAHAARRQRRRHHQHALLPRCHFLAGVLVDHLHPVAEIGEPGRAETHRLHLQARQQGQCRPAGFGLPVIVDDRLAERFADPVRGRFVQRLAGQEQVLQRAQVVAMDEVRVVLLQHADGGGRREHRAHVVLLAQRPPDARIRVGRQPFVEQRGAAADQRAVHVVGMADRPADVGGGEHHLARPAVEHRFHRLCHRHRIAPHIALHALRLAGGAGGIQQIARLARFQPLHRHVDFTDLRTQLGVVHIAARHAWFGGIQPTRHDQHVRRWRRGFGAGGVDHRLVRNQLATAHAGIGRDQQLGLGVVDAQRQVVRGKATEHHRVHRTDARAGQHREHGFGHVRHVDHHAVTVTDAEVLEHGGEVIHLAIQLAVGDLAGAVGLGGDGNQCELVGALGQVAVDGVVAEIGFTTDEPAPERRVAVVEHLLRRFVPMDALGFLAPEGLRLVDRATVGFLVVHDAALPDKVMGSRIVRRWRAGRPTLVGGGVLFCRACSPAPAESTSTSTSTSKAGPLRDGGVGPVAGGAVNPSMEARSPRPCGSRPHNRTHPAFDSFLRSVGKACCSGGCRPWSTALVGVDLGRHGRSTPCVDDSFDI